MFFFKYTHACLGYFEIYENLLLKNIEDFFEKWNQLWNQ